MNWTVPAIIAALTGTLTLTAVYGYLYFREKEKFVGLWTLGWLFYGLRFLISLYQIEIEQSYFAIVLHQLATLISGIFLLAGTYQLSGKYLSKSKLFLTLAAAMVFTTWVIVTTFSRLSFVVSYLPLFLLFGGISIWTGLEIYRIKTTSKLEKSIVGTAFILWGFHKFNYPFLRPVVWFAPIGFLIGAVFELIAAIGFLFIYFQRQREKIQENEKNYKTIVESSKVPMAVHDRGILIYANPKFVELHACESEEELKKIPLIEFVHPEDIVDFKKRLRYASDGNTDNVPYPIRIIKLNGDVAHLEVSSVPIIYEGKSVRLIICIDISEHIAAELARSQLEEQMLQSQKIEVVGRLAGGIAHDFNNMLTAILGNAELALMDDLNEETTDSVNEIILTAERAAVLTKQLLSFTRKNTGEPKYLDLNETVYNAEKMLLRLITEDISIKFNYWDEPVKAFIDPNHIEQILINLVVNSRDAINENGEIKISVEQTIIDAENIKSINSPTGFVKPDRYSMISVSDNGSGIPEDIIDSIFEPFFTTKPAGKGTGLGLSTIMSIIRQHKGEIIIDSNADWGTKFILLFPYTDESIINQKAQNIERAVPTAAGKKNRIMLVEDEPSVRNFLKQILTRNGYEVIEAGNGKEALTYCAESDRFDLVISDIIMPEMGGEQLANIALQTHPECKFVFISGYSDDFIRRKQGTILESTKIFPKPFSTPELLEHVHSLLED